ncbi:hypothetical protein CJ030_MR4G015416 [Morella rubra]|uniref:Uncharacterized protein n=1 Tax=Morella rubra TaxID=262757 RepID=A0A6A1VV17_9ROSI|nr:hypothetical protein CJ030_MR4G015416 [Morella rubra]
MGFMQNEDEEWVWKGVVTPQKGGEGGSDSEKEEISRTPMGTRTPIGENTPLSVSPPPIGYSSRRVAGSSHAPRLSSLEATMVEIKEEQQKLGKNMEELAHCIKTGFEDIKHILGAHTERFGTLDMNMRQFKL